MNSQFQLLTRGDAHTDDELPAFLGRAYNLKAVADYETGPGSVVPLDRGWRGMAVIAMSCNELRLARWGSNGCHVKSGTRVVRAGSCR